MLGQKEFVHITAAQLFARSCRVPQWPLLGRAALLLLRDVRLHPHSQRRDLTVTFGWCHNPPSTRNLPLREDSETSLPSGEGSWLCILERDSCLQGIVCQEACSLKTVEEAFLQLETPRGDRNSSWLIPGWRELDFIEPILSCLTLYRVQTLKRQGETLRKCWAKNPFVDLALRTGYSTNQYENLKTQINDGKEYMHSLQLWEAEFKKKSHQRSCQPLTECAYKWVVRCCWKSYSLALFPEWVQYKVTNVFNTILKKIYRRKLNYVRI